MSYPRSLLLVRAFTRHKRLFLFCTLLGLGAAMVVATRRDHRFESRSRVMVRYVIERTEAGFEEAPASPSGQHIIETEMEILRSFDVAARTAEVIGFERLLPEHSEGGISERAAIDTIRQGLTVAPVKESNLLDLAYRHRDPGTAVEVLETLGEQYFLMHLQIHRPPQRVAVLEEQLQRTRLQITTLDDERRGLENSPNATPDTIAALEMRRSVAEKQIRQLETSLQKARRDEALHAAGLPSISWVLKPTLARKVYEPRSWTLIFGLAAGGPLLGLIVAMLMEVGNSRRPEPDLAALPS